MNLNVFLFHSLSLFFVGVLRVIPENDSSKDLGFFNPRSQLNSTVVTYWESGRESGLLW